MRIPLRRKFDRSDGEPGPPPTWRRVHPGDLPGDVTALALPYVGASWRNRGGGYWVSRALAVVVLAVPTAAFAGLNYLFLWGEHRRGGYSPMFWFTAALLALGFCWAVASSWFLADFPFARLGRSSEPFVRGIGVFLQCVLLVAFLVLTPGMWAAALVDQSRGRPAAERLALADLDRQLADVAAGRRPTVAERRMDAATRWADEYDPAKPLRFPPRGELPDSVVIQRVPLLGTTWYERGPGYWLGRLLILLLFAFSLFVMGAVAVGFAGGVSEGHDNGTFWSVIAAETATNLAFLIYNLISISRADRSPRARLKRATESFRVILVLRYLAAGLVVLFVVGTIAKIDVLKGLALAPILLPVAFLGFGTMLFVFLQLCRPMISQEIIARDDIERQLRQALKMAKPGV